MYLSELLKKYAASPIEIRGSDEEDYDIQSVRLMEKGQSRFIPGRLYLTDTKHLPKPDQPGHFCVLCYGKRTDLKRYSGSTFTLVYLSTPLKPETLLNEILGYLSVMQDISAGVHILSNAVFSDRGLQHVVDTAAQLFQNPVYVVDLQGKYLAISRGIGEENPFLLAEKQAGYISDDGMKFILTRKVDEKIRAQNRPYYFYNESAHCSVMTDSIVIQGIEVGHVMLQESQQKLGEYDEELFHRFSRMIAIELRKNDFYNGNKGVMYSYFLADLIRNPEANHDVVKRRLLHLGFHLEGYLYVLVIPSIGQPSENLKRSLVIQRLQQILPPSIYMQYEENLVFLITKKADSLLEQPVLDKLSAFLGANSLTAGLSNYFQSLTDTSRFYRQAVDSERLGRHLSHPGPLYAYQDYYMYQMFDYFMLADKELRFLIHPGVMRLYESEAGKDYTLLRTLWAYLQHPFSSSDISGRLNIHKNTLLYRMNRIRAITGCRLSDGDDLLAFNLSFHILFYTGMLNKADVE